MTSQPAMSSLDLAFRLVCWRQMDKETAVRATPEHRAEQKQTRDEWIEGRRGG